MCNDYYVTVCGIILDVYLYQNLYLDTGMILDIDMGSLFIPTIFISIGESWTLASE
jgi:hypothetical protein